MDFLRLAMRDAKRNATRTLVAVIAVALASAVPVLSRMIPQGYVRGYGLAERTFAGGDILVWPAPRPVDLRDGSALDWRFWNGSDWQSDLIYFLPSVEIRGYLAEEGSSGWRPFTASEVGSRIRGVSGVTGVLPYLALPCTVKTGSGTANAILRGISPDSGQASRISSIVKEGRPLSVDDRGLLSALIPLHGGQPWEKAFTGMALEVDVPGASSLTLDVVGGYTVETGEAPVEIPQTSNAPAQIMKLPVYWERPEIIVTEDTFLRLASGPAQAAAGYPVYQVALTVDRMSSLESTAREVAAALGPDYAVYSVPRLLELKSSGGVAPTVSREWWPVMTFLAFGLSAVLVAGSVYILLAQQRRKIGLFRVIGATRANIVAYSMGIAFRVAATGVVYGYLAGKILSIPMFIGSDLSFGQWVSQAGWDLLLVSGVSFGLTAALGLAVGLWASRIPCAEVLRRD